MKGALGDRVFDSAPVGMGVIDRELRFVRVNAALAALHGVPIAEHEARPLADVVGAALAGELASMLRDVLRTGVTRQQQIGATLPATGAQPRAFHATLYPIAQDDGSIEHVGVIVTELSSAAALDLAGQSSIHHAMDAIPTVVFVTSRDRKLEFVNARYAEFHGTSRDEILRDHWESSVHPEDLPLVQRALAASNESGDGYVVEQRVRRRDGVYRWMLVQSNPVRDSQGSVVRWFGTATDIDDFKKAQAQLDALIEGAPVGVSVLDRDLRYLRVNQALADINGHSRDALLGQRLPDVLPQLGLALEPMFRRILETGEPVLNREITGETPREPGTRRYWLGSYYPIRVEHEIVGIASLVTEITSRKRVELALRVLATAGDVLTTSLDLRATVEGVVKLLIGELASFAVVHLAEEQQFTDEVFVACDDVAVAEAMQGNWGRERPGPESAMSRVLRSLESEVHVMDDALLSRSGKEPDRRAVMAGLRLRSVVVAPLVAHGRALGALSFGTRDRLYDEVDRNLGAELGRRIGAAVENARLFAVAEQRGEQLGRLQTFTAALASVRTVAEVVDVILTRGRPAFNAARGVLCLMGRDGQSLDIIRAAGYSAEVLEKWKKIPLSAGVPLTDVVVHGKPLFFDDTESLRAQYPSLAEGRSADDALLALPLVTLTRPIGSLGLEMNGRRDFNPEVQADLMAFGWLCAQAIERALLFDVAESERRRAEEANRAKDEFLAVLSHEIRTPLNAIMGWAKMLMTRSLDATQTAKAVATIERNARAQGQLIEDLLDVSRIITGKLKMNVEEVSVVRVVEGALDVVRPAAVAKGVRLEVDLDERVGGIMGDAARLQQVVWNLLANAVKFTDRGGRVLVRTSFEASRSPDAEAVCVLSVEDSGQGIPVEFLPHIFERFSQVDMGSGRAHGGLGLGLAIVRHLVELHGGDVAAFSEGKGRGSRFVVRLPLAAALTARTSSQTIEPGRHFAAQEHQENIAGLRILVVDDEVDARELLSSMLTHCGARVTATADATEALRAVQEELPDIMVSDIGMPGDDGYVLMRKVRALPAERGGRTPAIALTAYASLDDRTRALIAGFDAHVAKPIEPTELLVAIAHATGRLTPRPPLPT